MPGSKKAEAKLEIRQKDFDNLKSNQGKKRPGSQNIKKQR